MRKTKIERVGYEKCNNQGCLMKCIEYNKYSYILVEFQDKYKYVTNSQWGHFKSGNIKNPYFPEVLGVGSLGVKYPTKINDKHLKEYITWRHILERAFDISYKMKFQTYNDCSVCDEWLLYENFYEWLHSQSNFEQWLRGDRWAIDKDIIKKGNKLYSPDTCCLVPPKINSLFTKRDCARGCLPIGVSKHQQKYRASINMDDKRVIFPVRCTVEEAFLDYKYIKEEYIKQIAQSEFGACNITVKCYNAMMNYEVEITD